ncbi:MAG: serine/arginine repetitive matrix protein 2, partial [Mediterraneibacter gnavus]
GIEVSFFYAKSRTCSFIVHILDWALHVDEGTPHIHERHVFDCENKYGEICPQQEKALEKMGIPLPAPDKPKSRSNNRKKTFDAMCRELLLDICDNRKLYLDKEPEYGGRDYLEKQDYILMKQKEKLADQKEQIAQQEQALEELTLKIEDVEMLIDEVSDVAYDKAVEVVTDRVRLETQKEDLTLIEDYKKWVTSSERNIPKDKRDFVGKCLDAVQNKLIKAAQKVLNAVKDTMMNPKVKAESKEEIKKKAKSSVLDKLNQHRKLIADRDSDTDRTRLQKNKEMER